MCISREDLAWAAGLFEGEGSFSIHNARSGNPVASLIITDEDVIRKFHSVIRIGSVAGPYVNKEHPEWKPKWQWRASGFHVVQAVVALLWHWLCSRRRARAVEVLAVSRGKAPRNSAKIACKMGHLYDTKWASTGTRACSICMNARRRERRAEAKRSKTTCREAAQAV